MSGHVSGAIMNIFTAIKKWFTGLDKNNDGVVNAADAVTTIKNIADVNNDGVVNFADVKAAVVVVKGAIINVADLDNNGIIDLADVKVAAAVVKEKIKKTKSELNKMTKSGIQSYGIKIGVEIDRSLTKRQMIELLFQKQK